MILTQEEAQSLEKSLGDIPVNQIHDQLLSSVHDSVTDLFDFSSQEIAESRKLCSSFDRLLFENSGRRHPSDPRRNDLLDYQNRVGKRYTAFDEVHPVVPSETGCLIQFVYRPNVGEVSIVGAIRVGITEHAEILSYLLNERRQLLQTGLRLAYSWIGDPSMEPTESSESPKMSESYGVRMTVASLSSEGIKLALSGTREGPAYLLLYPWLIEPVKLGLTAEGKIDEAVVINCYIVPEHIKPTQVFREKEAVPETLQSKD